MAGLTEETTKLCYITPAFVDTGWDLEHISCEDVWFYRMDMPEGYKHFSETKPIQLAHFEPVVDWRENRSEIEVDGNPKAKRFTAQELKDLQYNFDQCGFPHDEEEILPPDELIRSYRAERARLDAEIDAKLAQICEILGIEG